MSSSRRLLVLLATAALAAAPVAPALAQSAGDQQYSDPLAGGTSKPAKKPKASTSATTSTSSTPSLSPTPQPSTPSVPSSGAATPTSSTPTPAATPAPAATASQLPRTGADVWLIALLGAALVLVGVGLRLRVAADGRR